MEFQAGYRWKNHGGNLQSVVRRYFEPATVEEVQALVREARAEGRKVRVIGDSHSWSPIAQTDDTMLSLRKLNRVLDVSRDPPRITVEPGVTIQQTMEAYREHRVCLPMNVDIPTLTIAGAVAVGANGFSRHHGPYSDFLEEADLVTGDGELVTVRRGDDRWRAVACSLGLCGIFTRLVLRLVPEFRVHVVNRVLPMEEALGTLSETFAAHDYVQYFWFPFNRDVTLQVCDVTDAPLTWTDTKERLKHARGWLETVGTHLAHPALRAAPGLTPAFDRLAARAIGPDDQVMRQCDNVMLGPWINYMVGSLNCSVTFPAGEGDERMRRAWQILVDLVDAYAARGEYPANLAANMRLFGPSEALLHRAPGTEGQPVCNIQITGFPSETWEPFKDELMERWMAIPGARPHWAKQYQGLPWMAERIRAVYGANLDAFLAIRAEMDPDGVFVNPFLGEVLGCR